MDCGKENRRVRGCHLMHPGDRPARLPSPSSPPAASSICPLCCRVAVVSLHYGVRSCLGCKSFYKREIEKFRRTGREPVCKKGGHCAMRKTPEEKRFCRGCRFRRCKERGMRPEALHQNRDKIGSRRASGGGPPRLRAVNKWEPRESADDWTPVCSPSSSFSQDSAASPADCKAFVFLSSLRMADDELRKRAYFLQQERVSFNDSLSLCSNLPESLRVELRLVDDFVAAIPDYSQLSSSTQRVLGANLGLASVFLDGALLTLHANELDGHPGVWLLPDRSCLVRSFDDLPPVLSSLPVDSHIREHNEACKELTTLLLDSVLAQLKRLDPTREEVVALKMFLLLGSFPYSSSSSSSWKMSNYERRQLWEMRGKVFISLQAFHRHLSTSPPNSCGSDRRSLRMTETSFGVERLDLLVQLVSSLKVYLSTERNFLQESVFVAHRVLEQLRLQFSFPEEEHPSGRIPFDKELLALLFLDHAEQSS